MTKPPSAEIPSAYANPTTNWSVSRVRNAITLHEFGDFYQSSQLADAMCRDGIIHGDLLTRVRALVSKNGLPFDVQVSAEGDPRTCRKLAEEVERIWDHICPEQQLGPAEKDSVMLGQFVGYIQWTVENGKFIPHLKHLPIRGLSLANGRDEWQYLDGDGIVHKVTPGDGKWVLHMPFGEDSRMLGAVRSLGEIWYMRHTTYRDYARFNEKHGMPILGVSEPHFASDDVEGEDDAISNGGAWRNPNGFYQQFRRLGSESIIRLPMGPNPKEDGQWDVKWIEPISQSYKSFNDFLKESRSVVTTYMLGVDLTTIPQGMGGDSASWSERIRVEFLASEAEALTTTIREQVLKPYVRFNFGEKFEQSTPWPRWDTRPAPDMKARAEQLASFLLALKEADAQGIDTDDMLEEFKLTFDPEKRAKVEEQRDAEAKLALQPSKGPSSKANG